MIVDPSRRLAISSFEWSDKDALWVFDAAADAERTIALKSGARYVAVHACAESDLFAVAHHFSGSRLTVTARSFAEPAVMLASVTADEHGLSGSGDAHAWSRVPPLYVGASSTAGEPSLLRVSPDGPSLSPLVWFDRSFDYGYQMPFDCVPLTDGASALVSVSRSSDLIVHDIASGHRRTTVTLAGRAGNPQLRRQPARGELWATDYDTILAIDPTTLHVRGKTRLQPAAGASAQFIGEPSFSKDESVLVPRPFSRDVIRIDSGSLAVCEHVAMLGQPLEAVMLDGGQIVARDWHSGRLLRGRSRA